MTFLDQLPPPIADQVRLCIDQRDAQIRWLEFRIRALEREKYGSKSEKWVDPNQQSLPMDKKTARQQEIDLGEGLVNVEGNEEEKIAVKKGAPEPTGKNKHRKLPKRKPLPENLQREHIYLPDPQNLVCPHTGKAMVKVAEETVEKLAFRRPEAYVIVYHRNRHASPNGQGHFTSTPWPVNGFDNSQVHVSLITQCLEQKFVYHMPFYRQQDQFKKLDLDLSRSTMCGWASQSATGLEPVYNELVRDTLNGGYMQSDDTTVKACDPETKGKCRTARLFLYSRPRGPVVFDFRMDRSSEGPTEFLKDFNGKLQIDAYAGYDEALRTNKDIIPFCCVAHCRRYFEHAQEEVPDKIQPIMRCFQEVYRVEAYACDHGFDALARGHLRQEKSRPVFDQIKEMLDREKDKVYPKSGWGKAVGYALNHWDNLVRFIDHGDVEIDNNLIENAIRPTAIGRKNWLFIGHPDAGKYNAILYSIAATCKRFEVDFYKYLLDVLPLLNDPHTTNAIELTPMAWKLRLQPARGE